MWCPWQPHCDVDSQEPKTVNLLHLSSTDVDRAGCLWLLSPKNKQSAPWFCWCWALGCFLRSTLQDCWFPPDMKSHHGLKSRQYLQCHMQTLQQSSLYVRDCSHGCTMWTGGGWAENLCFWNSLHSDGIKATINFHHHLLFKLRNYLLKMLKCFSSPFPYILCIFPKT